MSRAGKKKKAVVAPALPLNSAHRPDKIEKCRESIRGTIRGISDSNDHVNICNSLARLESRISQLKHLIASPPAKISAEYLASAQLDLKEAQQSYDNFLQIFHLNLQTIHEISNVQSNESCLGSVCKRVSTTTDVESLKDEIRSQLNPSKKWRREEVQALLSESTAEHDKRENERERTTRDLIVRIGINIAATEAACAKDIDKGAESLQALRSRSAVVAAGLVEPLRDENLARKGQDTMNRASQCINSCEKVLEQKHLWEKGLDRIDEWRWIEPQMFEYDYDQLP